MGILSFFSKKKTSLKDSGVLDGFKDCHTHILPGVDDGVKTIDDSLKILAYNEALGVRELWCTPHVMDDLANKTEMLRERFTSLQQAYSGSIKLHLGAEYMLDQEFEQRLQDDDLITLWDDVVLVETSAQVPPYNLLEILENILRKGYRPMMAHPERYRYMQMADYRHLHNLGVLFQLNLGSLVAYYGESVQKTALQLLKEGLYTAAGSDCHRLASLDSQYQRSVLSPEIVSDLKRLSGI